MAQCSISKNKLATDTDNIYIYIIFNCHSLTLFYYTTYLPIYIYVYV